MNKIHGRDICRWILQGVSTIYGLVGAFWILVAIAFIVPALRDGEIIAILIMLMFALLGVFLIYVAYIMLRRFSEDSLLGLCIIIGFSIFGYLTRLIRPYEDSPLIAENMFQHEIIVFAPIVIAYFAAWMFYRLSVKLTGTRRIQPKTAGDA